MAKVQTPNETVSKKHKNTSKYYCDLCRQLYVRHQALAHMHEMQHHRMLETVLCKDTIHYCQACRKSSMTLEEYAQHIKTHLHKRRLQQLMYGREKPCSLLKTLGKDIMEDLLKRNKLLNKEEKKKTKKKKKKEKQLAGQQQAKNLQAAGGANAQSAEKAGNSKQVKVEAQTQIPKAQQGGSTSAVFQNKENKATLQTGAWPAVPDPYRYQCGGLTDFTSDSLHHFPESNGIIFDSLNVNAGPPQPAHPASVSRSPGEAPIRDADVSAMLRQIRRALGVREPCRADREARRQSGETGVPSADQAGAKKRHVTPAAPVQASPAGSSSLVSRFDVSQERSKQAAAKMTKGSTQHCERSSAPVSDSNGPLNSGERESHCPLDVQTSLSQSTGGTTPSEPSPTVGRKVRIAHEPSRVQAEKPAQPKPTRDMLLGQSGPKDKLGWRVMYENMRKKKQERMKGMPRFGIEFSNADNRSSTQADDFPLSEGFHWESLPGSLSRMPSPPRDTTEHQSHAETLFQAQMPEQPATPQEAPKAAKSVSVKREPNLVEENEGSRDASKRKHKVESHDVSDMEPRSRKKKAKLHKDQDQMDQLLAVSLREEELSHTLHDLDTSLVQARNALQAAYTDVQRLLLMRQQCTAEVNSLRATRIEILQGMQGGYSGEKTSSAGAAPAAVQPRHTLLPPSSPFSAPSSQPPTPTISPPSVSPGSRPVKQEVCQPPTCIPNTPLIPVNQPAVLFSPLLLAPPLLANPTAMASPLTPLRTQPPTPAIAPPESSVRQREDAMRAGLNNCAKAARAASEEDDDSDSEEEEHRPAPLRKNNPCAVAPEDGGSDSDDSVKMMESSNQVIDIDESDNDEALPNVPVRPEPPQKSVSVEFSTAGTQTLQLKERKTEPVRVQISDAATAVAERVTVAEDEEPSTGAFESHTGPVHSLQIHEGLLYTCSGDNTARVYSLMTRQCQGVFRGHTNKVNCLLISSSPNMPTRLFTGASDQTIRCYSIKSQKCMDQISLSDRVLCLHIAWNILFAGLANGSVASYDLKTLKQLDVFECHGPRGVSCLGTAQEGARRVLLVGSYDSTISVRDAKSGLLLRSLQGHTKTVLCMKVVNDLVFSGSSDTLVHAHNIHTGELVRIYKGHDHAVTAIVILGKVMVTACLDQLVRVYELQSHDRLQVYGGHSDMVMCMAVHKSVIYTGCYDGTIRAVKLNLMKNYRCWWNNCALIFGMAEHLVQHLVSDHTSPNQDRVHCRWRGCSKFFPKQQSVIQELPAHMQNHAENDSQVRP